MTITTLRDALRTFAHSLQVSTLFPASFFVLVNAYFILPRFVTFESSTFESITLIVSSSLLLAYLLYAFNFPAIRFIEGYKLRSTAVNQMLRKQQTNKYRELNSRLDLWERRRQNYARKLKRNQDYPDFAFDPETIQAPVAPELLPSPLNELYVKWEDSVSNCSLIRSELEDRFPSSREAILATPIGNTIAAFEEYPFTRYGIDSVALWSRLLPCLKHSKYLEFVVQEKSTFDFLLNMLIVTVGLGIEFVGLSAWVNSLLGILTTVVVTIVVSTLFYLALIVAARQWGMTVRTAYDLHRESLFQALNLASPLTVNQERKIWQEVSSFMTHRQPYYTLTHMRVVKEKKVIADRE